MKMKEESSFLQGVESRLDSLFAEDTQPPKEKDADPPRTAAIPEEITPADEKVPEIPKPAESVAPSEAFTEPVLRTETILERTIRTEAPAEPVLKPETPLESVPPQDKSTFISEIEKRFSA
ncbi:MAG TPA: hypothetical protein VHO84_08840, partial [Syntrophorhabdaceae bacterium]|nr:hypothetical protein [Syntrophorhabdaceae bacterium]